MKNTIVRNDASAKKNLHVCCCHCSSSLTIRNGTYPRNDPKNKIEIRVQRYLCKSSECPWQSFSVLHTDEASFNKAQSTAWTKYYESLENPPVIATVTVPDGTVSYDRSSSTLSDNIQSDSGSSIEMGNDNSVNNADPTVVEVVKETVHVVEQPPYNDPVIIEQPPYNDPVIVGEGQ